MNKNDEQSQNQNEHDWSFTAFLCGEDGMTAKDLVTYDARNGIKLEFDENLIDKKWLGCQIEVPGYQLDDYHIVSKLIDRDGIVYWALFTFPNPIKNGIIEYSQNLKNTEIWHMDEISPNDFEWNGQKIIFDDGLDKR